MDYTSEEFQRNKKCHKMTFVNVLGELLQSWKTRYSKKNIHETINIKHEYIEFLQHTDFRRDLKIYYPDLVASIGHKYGEIELKGPACQVVDATVIIKEQLHRICEKQLTLSQSTLIWNIVAKNRWNEYFARQLGKENIKSKVCVGPSNALVILAFSQEECERAFEIMFEIVREDTLSIRKDCSVQSNQFQSLISKLQRGTLVQIEVLPNAEENVLRIIGVDEDIARAIQEISDFIKEDRIHSDTHRPQVSEYVWNFLARRVDHESVKQIAKDLEHYRVSIHIMDDHEQFLVCGLSKGIEQCKQRLNELASMIVERQKKLEYPGIKNLFLDQAGKEQLQMIEKEMDVEIEILRSDNKLSKAPVPLPRTLSLPSKKPESVMYDVCSFTTKEGLNVSWKYSSIENEAADVLVNSAHTNLNHPTACGRALMVRGGSCFQEACKPHIAIRPGDIIATESGNLLSKYVIHAVCRNLNRFKEPSPAHEFLRGLVRKILEKCHELGASSLAMPLIGAGHHGFPVEVVLQVIKNEINQLSSSKGAQLTLKDICIIVFQSKPERRKTVPLPTKPEISVPPTSDEKELNDASSSTEIAFEPVRICLCGGNASQYQADAMISLSSTNVRASTTASQSTCIQQGDDGIDFCDSTPEESMKQPSGTVLVTKASNGANVKYYMHSVPVPFDISGLERATKACLDAAKFYACNSAIILATEITLFNIAANECANAILSASQTFSNTSFAMDIRVVTLDMDMMQIFQKAFEEKVEEQRTSVEFRESGQIAGFMHAVVNDQRSANKILNIGENDEVIFRVVGFHDNVTISIEKIEAYFTRCKASKSVKDAKTVNGFWKNNSVIKRLSKGYEVFITLSAEEVSIEGMTEQVFECKDALIDFLNKHDEKERELRRLREISESVQWSYSDANGTVLFDEILNGMVESESRVGNKKFKVPSMENTHEVVLDKMIIKERRTGRTALLARKHMENTLVLPIYWEPQPKDENVHLVALPTSSNEYQKIIDLFGPANDLIIVEKIQRIQNPRLCKMYLCKKESMGMEANEKQLFHGTKSENISSINTNNFNRRFSGINGTRFGHGVYFARDASYSVRYSLKDSEKENSVFHMYVANVLVGKSVKGDKKMRVLPKRNDPRNPELFYDSAVDDTEDPSIFVTFDDHQCYPEYLITFKAA
ncbi:poly [ADP-ribose] polymerase 14-like [Paramuricea clavata]|uniref:Poly [ADP-ribose] polymerase 14-like n=1 Tax=Paramuricea clavata TaxID=317549 RepID=A0A6S7IVP2_PARCT|nr:poly [ADP-ribose] polymerase 14-like [Paramuricea clavata]